MIRAGSWTVVLVVSATISLAGRTAYAQRSPQAAHFLPANAHSVQGYLGVNFRDVSDDPATALPVHDGHGVEITQVDHDGPAGKAGVREHDLLLQLNGQTIEGVDQLRRMLHEIPAGRAVTLLLVRDGQMQTVNTVLANRELLERQAWGQHIPVPDPAQTAASPAPPSTAAAPVPARSDRSASPRSAGAMGFLGEGSTGNVLGPHAGERSVANATMLSPAYTGAALEPLGPQLAVFFGAPDGNGLLVRSVEGESPAAAAGLRAGDVVLRLNQVIIAGPGDWMRLVHESRGRSLQVTILRDKKEQTLTLIPDSKRRASIALPPLPLDPAVLAARTGEPALPIL